MYNFGLIQTVLRILKAITKAKTLVKISTNFWQLAPVSPQIIFMRFKRLLIITITSLLNWPCCVFVAFWLEHLEYWLAGCLSVCLASETGRCVHDLLPVIRIMLQNHIRPKSVINTSRNACVAVYVCLL